MTELLYVLAVEVGVCETAGVDATEHTITSRHFCPADTKPAVVHCKCQHLISPLRLSKFSSYVNIYNRLLHYPFTAYITEQGSYLVFFNDFLY